MRPFLPAIMLWCVRWVKIMWLGSTTLGGYSYARAPPRVMAIPLVEPEILYD